MSHTKPLEKAKRRLGIDRVEQGIITLTVDQSHYIRNVLRLKAGDLIGVFDGKGTAAEGTITVCDPKRVDIEVGEPYKQQLGAIQLTVALATPKGDRADLVVEKLTELGVSHIVWLECARSVVVPKPKSAKFDRWERLATSAARQCGRADTPNIIGPIKLADWLLNPIEHGIVAHPQQPTGDHHRKKLPKAGPVTLLIGPEGGFTEEELEAAFNAGYTSTGLGTTILRTETAAIAGASLILLGG